MGIIIYDFGIGCVSFLIKLASIFNVKARLWVHGRKNWKKHIKSIEVNKSLPLIWFHCASLGEFEQGRPLIEKYKSVYKSVQILVTFYSPSGYEVRKKYELANWVMYLPIDTKANAAHFVDYFNPNLVFFIKYEFWYHFLHELKFRNIPCYSVSAIFREDQLFFKPYGKLYFQILTCFDKIFVQNEVSYQLLRNNNIECEIIGDTRFDRVEAIARERKEIKLIERFKGDAKLWVIGSSWAADIKVLASCIEELYLYKSSMGEIKIVIAPHEVDEKHISTLIKQIKNKCILYSQAKNKDLGLYSVMIVDHIGLLSSIYAYADFAYVGGAFGKGLHNILEPATFGVPLFFGPKFHKFQEAIDLIKLGGAFSIKNKADFWAIFSQIAKDTNRAIVCKEINRKYIQSHLGATEAIFRQAKFNVKKLNL
jgi:3-deoxy-D-manno-octulosonic-acid transferase